MSSVRVRIDSELVNQARRAGALFDRPPTAQIEHWAKLGRSLESVLTGRSVAKVKERGKVADLDQRIAFRSPARAGTRHAH
jgi:hypothetical protein